MANLLKNPMMANWRHERYFTQNDGRVGTIEVPADWHYIAIPKETDLNKIPESLHRDKGILLSAAYMAWEAGYQQKGIQLAAKQRYVAKAVFKPDVNFMGQVDLTAVTWRFQVSGNGETIHPEWQVTTKGQFKQDEVYLYVFETVNAVTIDLSFVARSVYAGNDCDMTLYEIALEPVPADYGGATVPQLGKGTTTVTEVEPVFGEAALPTGTPTSASASHKTLAEVLTDEEIDTIVAGLRALALSNESKTTAAVAGLNKLADVLERLK